jgi:membrane fusion protein (multidrug efflux system)
MQNCSLTYTDIKAPSTGVVSKKNVQVGQLVQAGQTLFSIVNDNSIFSPQTLKKHSLTK